MADHSSYYETSTSQIYELPNPTNWTEVAKVIAVIRQEHKDFNTVVELDDGVTVEADEEHIRFRVRPKVMRSATPPKEFD